MNKFFSDLLTSITQFSSMLKINDVVDIAIVAVVVYQAIKLVRETRAEQLIKGIFVLLVILQLSSWFGLNTMQYILQNTMQLGLLALLVVFQPELRRGLERMGRSNVGKIFNLNTRNGKVEDTIDEIARAVDSLSKNRIGALICVERITKLGDIIKSGTVLNAKVTGELLVNIFVPNTPLHDGAVIIGGDTILAAACILPITHTEDLSRELGTRHRAAIGLSETCDAVVIVVSEETGKISIALGGDLTRNLTIETMKRALNKSLESNHPVKAVNKLEFWKIKKDKSE